MQNCKIIGSQKFTYHIVYIKPVTGEVDAKRTITFTYHIVYIKQFSKQHEWELK